MICKRCALIGVHRLFFVYFYYTGKTNGSQTGTCRKANGRQTEGKRKSNGSQTEDKRELIGSQTGTYRKPNGNLSEGKREPVGRQTEPHSNVFWTFPEKKIEKACLYEKEFLSLHPLNSNRVDPLAQLVEHNTFNVGVLGSSPKRITNKVAISHCNLFSLKKQERF